MAGRLRKRRIPRRKRAYKRRPNRRFAANVRRVIRRTAENKVNYNYTSTTFDASTGYFVALAPLINQGTSYYQRVGSQVQTTSMTYRGYIYLFQPTSPYLGTGIQKVRVSFISFKQSPPAASITLAKLMEDTAGTGDPNNIHSSWDPEFVNVLSDKTYLLSGIQNNYSVTGYRSQIQIKFHRKWMKKLNYVTDANDVFGDPRKLIYMAVWSEYGTTGVYKITISGSYKYNFIDV